MKSIIKMLGLSIGCSCTQIHAQQNVQKELQSDDALILTTVISDEGVTETPSTLSSLQDIGKIYAL